MKPLSRLRQIILAFTILLMSSAVIAQDKEAEERRQKEIQLEMQRAIQAEEMQTRKELLEEQRQVQQQQMRHLEEEYADQARLFERQAREYTRVPSSAGSTGSYQEGQYLLGTFGQESQSQLTLRKSFRGTTSTSKGEFDVESGIRRFRCMISGSVKSGEIFIGVEYPDGKTFKELVINASADINFSQSIVIKEGEEKKYTGSWSYVIKADNAEGNYMLQIMTH